MIKPREKCLELLRQHMILIRKFNELKGPRFNKLNPDSPKHFILIIIFFSRARWNSPCHHPQHWLSSAGKVDYTRDYHLDSMLSQPSEKINIRDYWTMDGRTMTPHTHEIDS